MIIIGYQGIGKSSVIARYPHKKRIDLESSNFWYNGKRHDDWYIYYCQIAMDLSSQGFTVFVSSHKEVRDFLLSQDKEAIYVIYPDLSIKKQWIERLERRYNDYPTDKNFKALMGAKERYEENIKDLMLMPVKRRIITTTKYDLDDIITPIEKSYKLQQKIK